MKTSNEIVDNLLNVRKKITIQINSLQDDLKTVDKLLEKHNIETDSRLTIHYIEPTPIRASAFIMNLMNENPTKIWKASELKGLLEIAVNRKEVFTKNENILWAVHNILKVFIKKGFAEKDFSQGSVMYKKKKIK